MNKKNDWRISFGQWWSKWSSSNDLDLPWLIFLDAEFRTLAQSLDPVTLVGLARTHDVDLRFFLPPPALIGEKDDEYIGERCSKCMTCIFIIYYTNKFLHYFFTRLKVGKRVQAIFHFRIFFFFLLRNRCNL